VEGLILRFSSKAVDHLALASDYKDRARVKVQGKTFIRKEA
jgi:hypothetical protein